MPSVFRESGRHGLLWPERMICAQGDLYEALAASAAIPALFAPVVINVA